MSDIIEIATTGTTRCATQIPPTLAASLRTSSTSSTRKWTAPSRVRLRLAPLSALTRASHIFTRSDPEIAGAEESLTTLTEVLRRSMRELKETVRQHVQSKADSCRATADSINELISSVKVLLLLSFLSSSHPPEPCSHGTQTVEQTVSDLQKRLCDR